MFDHPVKPVGYAPRTFNGVTIRKSFELPQGVQALWCQGHLLGVFRIGEQVPGIVADTITLHPIDYELAVKSHLEAPRRERRRDMFRRGFASLRGFNPVKLIKDRVHV
jgi:hypothetical protein